jgi:hypothetical protein
MSDLDQRRLDEVAHGLATGGISRARALRMLAGAALGVVLGGAGLVSVADPAEAACKRVGRRCGRRRGRCCRGARCRNGVCVCREGRARCAGRCFDLQTSEKHCGVCGNACSGLQVCQSGDCCRPSFTLCSDVCAPGTNCSACCSGFCFSDNTC